MSGVNISNVKRSLLVCILALPSHTFSNFIRSHLTRTSTWTDPRSLEPKLLDEFDWKTLPPGWEIFLDELGEIYYVQ